MANMQIQAIISAKDEASKVLSGFGKSIDDMNSRWKDTATTFKVGGAVMLGAAVGLTAGLIDCAKEFMGVEEASKMLEHAVIGVTGATQEQLKATSDLADELERKGVLDGDNIKIGLAQLSTFGLSNDAVRALGGSLADLAVNQFGVSASGEQLENSANVIAKALRGEFGILEKSGIRFTDAQKSIIEFGDESEKVSTIIEGFAQNLKYTNGVALTTFSGKLAHLKVTFGNIKETIGKVIIDALKPLLDRLMPIIEKISDWASKNAKLAGAIILVATAGLVLGGSFLLILGFLPNIVIGFKLLLSAVVGLFSPIGLLTSLFGVVLIGALTAFGAYAYTHTEDIKKWFNDAYIKIVTWYNNMKLAWQDPAVQEAMRTLKDAVKNLSDAVGILFGTLSGAPVADENIKTMSPKEKQRKAVEDFATAIYFMANALNALADAIKWVSNFWNSLKEGIDVAERFLSSPISGGLSNAWNNAMNVGLLPAGGGPIGWDQYNPIKEAAGGIIHAANGFFAPRGTDTIPAMLTPGEMVLNSKQQTNLFNQLNGGKGSNVTVNFYGDVNNTSNSNLDNIGKRISRQITLSQQGAL